MFAQSCVLPDFIQTIYLELEDHDVKEGYYTDILSDWQQKKFTVEGKSYLTLDIKEIKYIDLKYKFDVFQESYLSGSVIKLTSIKTEKYSKVKISLDRSEGNDLQKLYELGLDVDHGHYHRNDFFESDFSEREIGIIKEAGFQYQIVVDDVMTFYANQQATRPDSPENDCGTTSSIDYKTPDNWSLGSMGGYLTYQQMLDNLDSMTAKYPNLISTRQPIDPNNLTHEGFPIYWLRISDNPNTNEPEPEILYDALHHAREPGSLSQLIFYMWYLLENYATDPEIKYLVDQTEMCFVPCVNPDGYMYNEQTNPNGGGLWRKNRRLNSGNNYGVDLNRNYGYQWGFDNTGSSPNTSSATYRGPSAFSEPETQNMRDFTTAHHFRIAMNYHTYGNLLVYPWGYNDQLTPDANTFLDFSDIMTRKNNYTTGTGMQTVGYTVNGDSDDWMYGDTIVKNKIISMTPEAGYSFWASINDIESICKDNLYQNLTAAHLILNYGEIIDQTSEYLTTKTGHMNYDFKRFGFENGPMVASFTPVSSNIVSFGAPKIFQLNQLQTASDSFSYTLDANTQDGEAVIFVAEVNNGLWISRDTITKYYSTTSNAPTSLLNDDLTDDQNWQNLLGNTWLTTSSDYYSAPKSMTDSPNGNYQGNSTNQISTKNAVDLSNAVSATLTFWTKWDIETSYDYVQVGGSVNSSSFYTPLCGLYTKSGSQNQAQNEPLYDGLQDTWVQESIDLVDFIGGNFYLSFTLIADGWVEQDGYYFDDVQIQVNYQTGSETISLNDFIIKQNQPNPTKNSTTIQLENYPDDAQLVIFNSIGQEMYRQSIQENQTKINTVDWNAGIYFYRIESTEGVSKSFKMEVIK
jgi:hypothetical protein